jgi:preprotein translocase subunit SecA
MRKIKHNVLNAKQHQREAEVVAEAGQVWSSYHCYQYGWKGNGYKT